ncbi:MAG: hypothetical protein ACD_58C00073G0004 [uncultured bacterium]|nr:MAG: hypothetical protein ACD_58C00073G0004 [uncultured bacterium]
MTEGITPVDGLDFEFELKPVESEEVIEKSPEQIALEIFEKLKKDLEDNKLKEKVIDVPVIEQGGGTDCVIACLRMILLHFKKYNNEGLDNFVNLAKDKFNIVFPKQKGIDGNFGYQGHPFAIQNFIE